MPHDASLIATVAAGFGLALILGVIASHLRTPPLVGYLVAGVLIGPFTPGFVGNVGLASQLAEIGVMLLMFGVGLHFSFEDLMSVRHVAVPGALVKIVVATAAGMGAAVFWGWGYGGALVFGLCLSVASTVIVLRALEAKSLLKSINGHIVVGWVVVEDMVMVLMLVLLPAFGGLLSQSDAPSLAPSAADIWTRTGATLAKIATFIFLMLVVGRRIFPKVLWWVARSGSRELFTLCVIATAIGVAFGAAHLFDVSFALGAFFAGMMMRESEFSHRAADESLPLRDAFAVLFFVSVGMLFDPAVLWNEPFKLLLVVGIIMLANPIVAAVLVLLFRYPLNTALTIGASLAQIGEFSFILAGMGVAMGLLPKEGQHIILAGALISMSASGAIFAAIEPVQKWVRQRSAMARRLELRDDPLAQLPMSVEQSLLSKQVVLVGYGRVGRRIGSALRKENIPFVVAELNRETVEALRKDGIPAVSGDASTPEVLIQAHIARAAVLVVAVSETLKIRHMVEIATTLNSSVSVVVCTHSEDEAKLMRKDGMGEIFLGEQELARNMVSHVITKLRGS